VVEILSPGTAVRDRKVKFAIYQQHGVREYWMVEPYAGSVEVWRLENGEFRRFGVFGQDESFVSAVLGGRELELADIFK
jgi:Uma2 family endonuclease